MKPLHLKILMLNTLMVEKTLIAKRLGCSLSLVYQVVRRGPNYVSPYQEALAEKARRASDLYEQGLSYVEIAHEIGASSSVSVWRLLKRNADGSLTPRNEPAKRAQLKARLLWQYGEDRTLDILLGNDAATEADKALWRNLGRNNHVD